MRPDLQATLTGTYDLQARAVVDLPGGSAELRPAELRALSAALLRIAADTEARPLKRRAKPTPSTRRG